MSRRNPQSVLPEGVFDESFGSGILDLTKWDVDNQDGSSVSNIAMHHGMLRLALNQAPTTFSPSASAIISDASFSYGTYEFNIRASSTAPAPTAAGSAVSGSVTAVRLRLDSTRHISVYFFGGTPNTVQLNVTDGATTAVNVPLDHPEKSFQTLKIVWAEGKVDFYFNNVFVQTITMNVSSSVMKIMFSHLGSNVAYPDGLATPSTPRYAYISHVRFTPPAGSRQFSFTVSEAVTHSFTLTPEVNAPTSRPFAFTVAGASSFAFTLNDYVPPTITRDFDFTVASTAGYTGILSVDTTPPAVITRDFVFTVAETVAYTVALTTTPNPNIQRDFAFTVDERVLHTFSVTRTGGGVASTTGWLNPISVIQTGWTSLDAIKVSDDTRATSTVVGGSSTPELWAYNFSGLSIPEGSVINGIRVNVEGTQSGVVDNSYFRLINLNTFTPKSAGEKLLTLPNVTVGGAGDTGWVSAGTAYLTGWTNPDSSKVLDGASAFVSVTANETPPAAWANFDWSGVPAGASIVGIEARINGRTTVADDYSYFNIGNVGYGTPYSVEQRSVALPINATTTGWTTVGGPLYKWGNYPGGVIISKADLTSDFGIAGAWGTTNTNTYVINSVQLKVYYTTAGGGGTEAAVTLGSTTDLWGNVDTTGDNVYDRLWFASDFNSNLTFWGQFTAGAGGCTIALDNVQLNVSYTTPVVIDDGSTPIVSANTGWGTGATNNVGWTNAANSRVPDGSPASNAFTGVGSETPYLIINDFAHLRTIPMGAVIDGIEARFTGRTTATAANYFNLGDVQTGTPLSVTTKGDAILPVSATTMGTVTIGSPTDKWGGLPAGVWSVSDLTAVNFGIAGAWTTAVANTAYLDGIELKVYYTTGGTSPGVALPLPTKIFATYCEGYQGVPLITDVPLTYNQIYLFQTGPVGGAWQGGGAFTFNGYVNAGEFTAARIAICRAAPRFQRVVLTIGGQNANYAWLTRTESDTFLTSIYAIISQLGVIDGVDFNNFETFTEQYKNVPGAANALATEMIYISRELKRVYGTNFSISAAPAAGAFFAPDDRVLMAAMFAANAAQPTIDYVGPQFYDSPDFALYSTGRNITNEWIALTGSSSRVVYGTGSNFEEGTASYTKTQVVQLLNEMRSASTPLRGIFGFASRNDWNANWSFANTVKPAL